MILGSIDLTTATGLINNLGFPIAMVFYFIWDKCKSTTGMVKTIQALQETINNNTLVLNKLLVKMDKEELLEKEG